MRKLFESWFFPVLIVLLCVFVALKNYVPGTWLLGWDNLAPELNFKLNIARSLSAVWQEYQGVGLLGGMAHAADLPRQIVIWFFSLFTPISFLRYLWTFLMLIVGPLGVYFLIRTEKSIAAILGAFGGAVFYLFNLATLQTFFTPYESFVSFYGFFPWLLYLAQNYLRHGGRNKLIAFAAVSFFAACAFYVQTLFIVYGVFLVFFGVEAILRIKKSGLIRSIKLALVTFFINAFWLLPALYFAVVSPGIPGNSQINSIATPETQIMNQARSGFSDVATLKGYWFDYFDWGSGESYDYLYKEWMSYFERPEITNISIGLFFAALLGSVLSLTVKEKRGFRFSYLALFTVCFVMLSGYKFPGGFLAEAFRNAFTKWSTAASLIYAVGIGSLIYAIGAFFGKRISQFIVVVVSVSIVLLSLYTLIPVLSGHLIADSMRVKLPSYYRDSINYLVQLDHTKRVAIFPITDFWGWQFNDWGYRGSGFLWYGIPQPVLSRTFDVWSPKNENFYNEISQAVISENADNLKYVLNKYQVNYVLFDGSIIRPGNQEFPIEIKRQYEILKSSGLVSEAEFGKITIYKFNLDSNPNNFVSGDGIDRSGTYIKVGSAGDVIVKETFLDSQGYQNAKNCNLKGSGEVEKKKWNGGNYYHAAGNGVSCDYFYYPTLSPSKAYRMRIKGRNLAGRSLKFYLYSVDKKTVLLEALLPVGDFDKYFDIPPVFYRENLNTKDFKGYTLNVETRSFGKVVSANIINAVEFYSLDFSFSTGLTFQSNNLKIQGVQKYGIWGYKIDIQGDGILQLGQGYNQGWVGLGTKDGRLVTIEHREFNGWANGWFIPKSVINNQSSVIYLVYWPQFLQWGGLVLGTGLTFLLVKLYYHQ